MGGFEGCSSLRLSLTRKAGVFCNGGTRKGAGVLRTLCLYKAAGSRGKDESGSVVRFKGSRSRVEVVMGESRLSCEVSVRLGGGGTGNITVGNLPVQGTDRLFKMIGLIFFSPRSLGVVGGNPNREEEFLSLRLYRLSGVCLASLTSCGRVMGREGGLLGSLDIRPSLGSALSV